MKLLKSFMLVGLALSVTPVIAGNTNSGGATCAGGAWISATAQPQPNGVAITVNVDSNAMCGQNDPQVYNNLFAYDQFVNNQEIYNVDATGCGGAHWDIGGKAKLNGACSDGWCTYYVVLTSHHGGVGHQPQCTNQTSFNLNFQEAQ